MTAAFASSRLIYSVQILFICLVAFACCSCDPYIISEKAPPHLRALRVIKELHAAEEDFRVHYGRYASLTELTSGEAGSSSKRVLLNRMAGGSYTPYVFRLQAGYSHYVLTAVPIPQATTERVSYYTDESLLIHFSYDPLNRADASVLSQKFAYKSGRSF